MSSRTIDNLGPEPSIRYAIDSEELDKSLTQDSRAAAVHATVDVTAPYYPSEADAMVGSQLKHYPFSAFKPPLRYNIQKRRIFTHQVLPSLGSDEMLLTHQERLRGLVQKHRDKHDERENKEGWEEDQEMEDEEKESEVLLAFFDLLISFDKILLDVFSGRNQFQRG